MTTLKWMMLKSEEVSLRCFLTLGVTAIGKSMRLLGQRW